MKQHPQIVNFINFIRAYMTEEVPEGDNLLAVREQIRLAEEYHLKTTFLVLYDVFDSPEYLELLKALDPARYEIGIWYEIDQPLCEAAGIPWRGEEPWDKHCDVGYPMGYTKEERKRLADENFRCFREVFGYSPAVFGSWFSDSYTIRYICDTYGLDAMCSCKEQYGTDGYTLWGGYWGQAYYPSRTNVFMPAQTAARQLKTPMFKMLGSDPVYQYDFGLNTDEPDVHSQYVITLEPVYPVAGGGLPKWVDWYLRENFNGECLSFGYAQAGQENSFGWQRMGKGLCDQIPKIAKLRDEGKLTVETLGESGRRYRAEYGTTPMSAVTAHSAYDDPAKKSVWFGSGYYRVNLYAEAGRVWIRDLHVFDETLEDPFENAVCVINDATYDTLPVADGFVHSGNGVRSGLYLDFGAEESAGDCDFTFTELEDGCEAAFRAAHSPVFTMREKQLTVRADADFTLRHPIGRTKEFIPEVTGMTERELCLRYRGHGYRVTLEKGRFVSPEEIRSEDGEIRASFSVP